MLVLVFGLLCFYFTGVAQAGLFDRYNLMLENGLYNSSDKVIVLTTANINSTVLQQKYTTLVEFYNSYCGHCRRFAPVYKKLAQELFSWRDFLKICAIDCSTEENNGFCREYEIMSYPSLRFFGLNFQANGTYGKTLDSQNTEVIRETLLEWIAAQNGSDVLTWPNFQNLSADEVEKPFSRLNDSIKYMVLVYEPGNSTVGTETILNFQSYPSISIRKIKDLKVAAKFQIDGTKTKIAIIDREMSIESFSTDGTTFQDYKVVIERALNARQVTEKPASVEESSTTPPLTALPNLVDKNAILKEVRSNRHLVYQADLEIAVRTTLFSEIPRRAEISGEESLALQRYLGLLKRYNPLGIKGASFLSELYEFVTEHNQSIKGTEFEKEVKKLEEKHEQIFSARNFIGCTNSKAGLRGFTCSLWQLFHYLTVQAATNDLEQEPSEVLQAMHGYVKHFFGCTDCSQHFQEMAARRKIWNTSSKDDAVLWLWSAHNEVNQRLSGDNVTEDPEFPKIQFPSQLSCPECRQELSISTTNISDIHWNKDAVLQFLKNIHNPQYVSRFGISEAILQVTSSPQRLRQKRMIGNVFSEVDMRMGMMLYGFCIVMMVVAFKLFAFKSYRTRKSYGQDLLGKI